MTMKTKLYAGVGAGFVAALLSACAPVDPAGNNSAASSAAPAQSSQKLSVALAQVGTNCPAGATDAGQCAGRAWKASVSSSGAAFVGSEDERAAARLAIAEACAGKGLRGGKFTLTDGAFKGGNWVFDDACL